MNKYKYQIVTDDGDKQVTVYAMDEAEAEAIATGMAQQLVGDADGGFYVGLISSDGLTWEAFAEALKRHNEPFRGDALCAVEETEYPNHELQDN